MGGGTGIGGVFGGEGLGGLFVNPGAATANLFGLGGGGGGGEEQAAFLQNAQARLINENIVRSCEAAAQQNQLFGTVIGAAQGVQGREIGQGS